MNFSDDMNGIIKRDKNIVHLFEDTKPKATVTQCPRITAMDLMQEHNMDVNCFDDFVMVFCGTWASSKYHADFSHKKDALVAAIKECLDLNGIKY